MYTFLFYKGHPSSVKGREAIFNLLDVNKTGFIEKNGIKEFLNQLDFEYEEGDLNQMINSFGSQNGQITKEMFLKRCKFLFENPIMVKLFQRK